MGPARHWACVVGGLGKGDHGRQDQVARTEQPLESGVIPRELVSPPRLECDEIWARLGHGRSRLAARQCRFWLRSRRQSRDRRPGDTAAPRRTPAAPRSAKTVQRVAHGFARRRAGLEVPSGARRAASRRVVPRRSKWREAHHSKPPVVSGVAPCKRRRCVRNGSRSRHFVVRFARPLPWGSGELRAHPVLARFGNC